MGGARERVGCDEAKRECRNTISAAVADVRLNDDGIELGPYNRARRANFEASCADAVLAHIAHQEPAAVLAVFSELLDEFDVAPMDAVKPARVVVAVAPQRVHAAV